MRNLKRSSPFYFIVVLFLANCSTSSYRIANEDYNKTELSVTPDRVLLQCEWLHDADIEGLYGFMIHVLDEEKTVLTVSQSNTLGKKECFGRIKKISKILREGKNIYIAGMGDLKDTRIKEKTTYAFPSGTFNGNGRVLQFRFITNEHGSCYSSDHRDEKPCPRDGFPIHNTKSQSW